MLLEEFACPLKRKRMRAGFVDNLVDHGEDNPQFHVEVEHFIFEMVVFGIHSDIKFLFE